MFELIGSEASYLRSLRVVINHFYASKPLKKTLSRLEHHTLFSNICGVTTASERLDLPSIHLAPPTSFASASTCTWSPAGSSWTWSSGWDRASASPRSETWCWATVRTSEASTCPT